MKTKTPKPGPKKKITKDEVAALSAKEQIVIALNTIVFHAANGDLDAAMFIADNQYIFKPGPNYAEKAYPRDEVAAPAELQPTGSDAADGTSATDYPAP